MREDEVQVRAAYLLLSTWSCCLLAAVYLELLPTCCCLLGAAYLLLPTCCCCYGPTNHTENHLGGLVRPGPEQGSASSLLTASTPSAKVRHTQLIQLLACITQSPDTLLVCIT